MDEVARLPPGDRADLFAAVAGRRGLSPEIIEKDFWVCWTLKRLFTLPSLPSGLLFKGGTSLSKVYKAIDRFSEDVDLSFDRAGLGFGGEKDPINAKSGKKKKHGLEALKQTCQLVIRETILPQLTAAFAEALGEQPSGNWGLELDREDPDQQTLLFHYPQSGRPRPANEPAYLQPFVRLEIGSRADHWPAREAPVTPYAAEDFPHLFRSPSCTVHVLAAERTFWGKGHCTALLASRARRQDVSGSAIAALLRRGPALRMRNRQGRHE